MSSVVTVVRTNVAGAGYVNMADASLPPAVVDALEQRIPYWSPTSTQPSVREDHGELQNGYQYLSVGIFWPKVLDEYGRAGVFCWVSRVYRTDGNDPLVQDDMEAALAVIREGSDWLGLPLQIVAGAGAGLDVIVADLSRRITARRSLPAALPRTVAAAPAPSRPALSHEPDGNQTGRSFMHRIGRFVRSVGEFLRPGLEQSGDVKPDEEGGGIGIASSGNAVVAEIRGGSVAKIDSPRREDEMAETEERGAIGITLSRGSVIADIRSGSPAETAGLRKDDKIVEIGGQLVLTYNRTLNLLAGRPNSVVEIAIERGGERMTFVVERARWRDIYAS